MSKNIRFMLAALTGIVIASTAAPAFAQAEAMRGHPMMGGDARQGQTMGGGAMGPGMMGDGSMGPGMMGGMMSGCQKMMSGGAQLTLPQLPAGNDALQFRMHAEMMQKIGEIAVRYADRIDSGK